MLLVDVWISSTESMAFQAITKKEWGHGLRFSNLNLIFYAHVDAKEICYQSGDAMSRESNLYLIAYRHL